MLSRSQPRWPLLILALTLIVVFHRLLLGEVFFWGLPTLQFYPWREYAFDLLRQGHLSLWNPYNGAGAPLLANYQTALLYPPSWLGLILPLAWAMSVTAVLHLFIAGWGMWQFTGRLGLPTLGRGMSALAFGLTGYLVARLGTYPTISAAAWLPWLLWAALGVLTQARRRDLAWLALLAGLQLLAGHAQTTWYSLLLVGAFIAWWSVTHRPVNGRRLALVIAGLTLGAGIAALQLLPTGELLTGSQRSGGVDFDFAMNFSYGLPRALNFLSPNIFGNPGDGSYITEGAFFEDAVYIGLIPLISALVAGITWAWGRLRRAERPAYFASVPFWLLIVVIAFVFALGENTPVFPFLYRNVPTFSLFQAPVRWHIWTVFGLSVLAGVGVGMWGHGYWLFFGTRLATAAGIGAVLLAIVAPRLLPPNLTNAQGVQVIIRAVIETGVLGALAGVLTLTHPEQPTGRRHGLWSFAVLAVIAADLGYAAWGLNPTVPASFYDRRTVPASYDGRAYWPKQVDETVKFEQFLPFEDYRVTMQKLDAFRASNLPNLNLLDRTSLLNNFDPLQVGSFARYSELIETHPQAADHLLRGAGVTAVYHADGTLRTLPTPGVRAWFPAQFCWHLDEASIAAALIQPDWKPEARAEVLYDAVSRQKNPQDNHCISNPAGTVGRITDAPNRVTLEVTASQSISRLVLADTAYPGWQVSLDGQPYGYMTANLAFQSVSLPEGQHTLVIEYRPWWLIPGALISLVSLLITLALFRSSEPDEGMVAPP
jgi:hypothetical protein